MVQDKNRLHRTYNYKKYIITSEKKNIEKKKIVLFYFMRKRCKTKINFLKGKVEALKILIQGESSVF